MRKFHTYLHTEHGLSRGLIFFNKKVIRSFSLESRISRTLKEKGDCSILEVGTGKSVVLLELCSKFKSINCTGLNKNAKHGAGSRVDLRKTADKLGLKISNLPKIIISDATKLPFDDETFDIVISQVAFMHFRDKLIAIHEISRVLKVEGEAFLDLDSWQMKKNKKKGSLPTEYAQILSALKKKVTPRILFKKGRAWQPLEKIFMSIDNQVFLVRLTSRISKNPKYYPPSFNWFLYVHKKKTGTLNFPFKRNAALSNKMTNLPITDHNPASYGIVDVYTI